MIKGLTIPSLSFAPPAAVSAVSTIRTGPDQIGREFTRAVTVQSINHVRCREADPKNLRQEYFLQPNPLVAAHLSTGRAGLEVRAVHKRA
jgi:hypothetical protein